MPARTPRSRMPPRSPIPPMPTRPPPFVVFERHQVPNELDYDWTLNADKKEEKKQRQERNLMIKEKLQNGRTVQYRSSGWSLWPKVRPNDMCTFEPVASTESVEIDDIVFCEVQPHYRLFAHIVSHIGTYWNDNKFPQGKSFYEISNIRGHRNGWCYIKHIHGKLIDVYHDVGPH